MDIDIYSLVPIAVIAGIALILLLIILSRRSGLIQGFGCPILPAST